MVYYEALGERVRERVSSFYLHPCGFIIFKAVIVKMFRIFNASSQKWKRKTLFCSVTSSQTRSSDVEKRELKEHCIQNQFNSSLLHEWVASSSSSERHLEDYFQIQGE